jgi:OmpA-OmpF porin, OOP family
VRLALLVVFLPAIAFAQDPTVSRSTAFDVDRLTPPPGPGAFFQVEDGDVAPHLATSFGAMTTVLHQPLVVYSVADTMHVDKGETLSRPVETRVALELMAAIGLYGRYQVGLVLPLVLFQDGDRLRGLDLPAMEENQPLATTTQGDLRLHGKIRLVEPPFGYGLGVATDVVLTLPTGDDEQFAGEAGPVIEARLIGSWRTRRFAAAANLGPRLRTEEVQFLDPTLVHGNEIGWGRAGSVLLPGGQARWTAVAELTGAWGVDAGDGTESPDPSEVRGGVRYDVMPGWSVGAALGGGLGERDVGSPAWRFVADVRFTPRTNVDSDRDGVPDPEDRCPLVPEDLDGTDDGDGCIDRDDDGDEVPDVDDRCPRQAEDADGWRDLDGCPELDDDDDGVPDATDVCRREPEDRDGVKDQDGCPDADDDGDGLADKDDACPREAEDVDGFGDNDGCPDLDDDLDGVADAQDLCKGEIEDQDGFRDDDGCQDTDDDRDGVADGIDKCPDQPETMDSLKDANEDGCPDGAPIAKPAADGTVWLAPAAKAQLRWKKGDPTLSPTAARVILAIALAAHRAGWDEARPALKVSVPDDKGGWSDLAERRSEAVVEALRQAGVSAEIDSTQRTLLIRATPEALQLGPTIPIKQSK